MRVPKWAKWFGGGIVFVLVAIVGGTFVYIHFIEDPAPPKLTFENVDKSVTTTTGDDHDHRRRCDHHGDG